MIKSFFLVFRIAGLLITACVGLKVPNVCVAEDTQIKFTDMTAQARLEFSHDDGSDGRHFIVEYVSGGLSLFDYDNDGDVDIYFLNGAPAADQQRRARPNMLFRNDGNWQFTNVTKEAGVGDLGHGLGVTIGDYDNDGHQDIYVNNFGPNRLYRNNANGTFRDVTEIAGVANGNRVGAGTSFLDIDQDGDLDLYVANYLEFSYDKTVDRTSQGYAVYASPLDYKPDPDTLYRNNGDGTFTDVSDESGVGAHRGYGMGLVCADYDGDGDVDVIVGNDVGANFVFQNDGKGKFKEVGLLTGFAYDRTGSIQGTMGVDCADFDNDGYFDLHVTSYQNELATLYRNVNGVFMEDVTNVSGAGLGTNREVTWGNGLVDFDNDGDQDIFIACGHLYPNVEKFDDQTSYKAENLVFENRGKGRFVNVTDQAGSGMKVKLSSRGAGFDDLDNDGDIDVVVLNSRAVPTLLRNDSAASSWIELQLVGDRANRFGVGARIEILADGKRQFAEARSGRGYQSHYGSTIHFGLGNATSVDEIKVLWPGGNETRLSQLPVNQRTIIQEKD
ncbi:MAG: hypothetical protein CMJ77_15875 [Planctomycetaceae bacterium]|nr:hypothetical protein [Planctomycetaceae bacterium]